MVEVTYKQSVGGAMTSNVELVPVADLIPYVTNARTHTDAQVDQISASIREYGWTSPVLIDEMNTILAGHARVMAAEKMGLDRVPCLRLSHLTEAQKRAYVIADNQLALNAGWNEEMLSSELRAILDDLDLGDMAGLTDEAMPVIGFTREELEVFGVVPPYEGGGDSGPEEAPEPPVNPVTRSGDLWLLGKHRLFCGDCTKADDVERVLGGVEPHLMVTDPPYGVEYDASWRSDPKAGGKGAADKRAVGKVTNDDQADWREAWALFPGDVAYVWHAGINSPIVSGSLIECGLEMRALIIWAKSNYPMGRGDYHHQHEPCWYVVRKNHKGHYCGGRKQTTLWQIDSPRKSETGHSTQKPVECMRRPIVNNSKPGQAVYEPFSGSGTTIIAGEMEGRPIHAIEIAPEYVDVGVERWQGFTGGEASLDGDGRTFAEVAQERLGAEEAAG